MIALYHNWILSQAPLCRSRRGLSNTDANDSRDLDLFPVKHIKILAIDCAGLDWTDVKHKLKAGTEPDDEAALERLVRADVESEYPLDNLDPTQRVFADVVLKWIEDLARAYEQVRATGKAKPMPKLRAWLGGSAGSGKSTTLKAPGHMDGSLSRFCWVALRRRSSGVNSFAQGVGTV